MQFPPLVADNLLRHRPNRMMSLGRLLLRIVAILALAACVASPLGAAPLAGTELVNRATVTYTDPGSGAPMTLDSNAVRVFVQPLESFILTPGNSARTPAGGTAYFSHRLTNTGNTTSSYVLRVENLSGDNFDLSGLTLIQDVNSNGQPDAGEPQITPGSPVTLAPDQSLELLISGTVPTTVSDGQTARVGITATTVLQGVTASDTDTVVTEAGIATQVTNSATVREAKPGDQITFTPTAVNLGNGIPAGIEVMVDGVRRNL
ncbi:MAG: hypothetical protein M3347_05250, partial [Armatimonadota bacterium]|nr:hypothetical protein [Armatimonadota bacterium]